MTRRTHAYITLHRAYTTSWDETVVGAEFEYREIDGKRYYAVEPGTQFAVRVHLPQNYTRTETVVSIDGRDVLKNEPADFEKFRGLVTNESHVDVKGWRISESAIKVFVSERLGQGKTTSEKSGGAKSARGAIGAAIFTEKREAPVYRMARGGLESMTLGAPRGSITRGGGGVTGQSMSYSGGDGSRGITLESLGGDEGLESLSYGGDISSNGGGGEVYRGFMPMGASKGGQRVNHAPAPSVGTAAGHTATDIVGKTAFVRDGGPTILEIEYDSRDNLVARGIFERENHGLRAWAGMPQPTSYCDPNKL